MAYLPDRTYLTMNQTIREILDYFQDFYADFSRERAEEMLKSLGIDPTVKMRTLSKGTKEKVQLILVMSREAKLYLLDEPIGGVDPATCKLCIASGANVLVAGSSVYKAEDIPARIRELRG